MLLRLPTLTFSTKRHHGRASANQIRSGGRGPKPRRSLRHRLLSLGAIVLVLCWVVGIAGTGWGQSITQARITEILESSQVFIQNRPARVNDLARGGEQVKTGRARAELRFNTGAIGRMTHNSLLTIGGRCHRLQRGTILVSGAASTCTANVVLGVRGTVYTLAVDEQGMTELNVLEGQIDLTIADPSLTSQAQLDSYLAKQAKQGEPLQCRLKATPQQTKAISCPALPIGEGLRVSVNAFGQLLALRPLTQTDFLAILRGPLLQDYQTPLPQQDALKRSFERLYPGVPFPLLTPTVPSVSPPLPSDYVSQLCALKMDIYRQELRLLVDQGWEPPRPPAKGLWSVFLRYELNRQGQVEQVEITKSSGYPPFDQSAVNHINQIQSQFSPLPDCYPHQQFTVTHRFQLDYR